MSDKADQNTGMHRADFVTGIVVLAFSIAIVYLSVTMPRLEHRDINPLSAPGVVPGLLGIVIGLCSLVLLIRAIVHRGYRLGITSQTLAAFMRNPEAWRVVVTIAICLIYAWGLVGWLNYSLATFIFILGFIVVFDLGFSQEEHRSRRRIVAIAAIEAVLVTGVVSGVFRYLFLVSLP
ncbi:MAG: tripartite tricarboxylate transporter TctB family protein [Spirochaetota bacterium]